jgi:SAM-dependent methyltransferase
MNTDRTQNAPFTIPLEAPSAADDYGRLLRGSFSSAYDGDRDVWSDEPAMREVVSLLLGELAPESDVLDVGAGRGRDTRALLQAGHRVDAIDLIATPDWEALSQRWPERLRFIQGDLMGSALDRVYGGVLDNGCLHHQHPDVYGRYLRRLHALTRERGIMVVSFFLPRTSVETGRLWSQDDGRMTREFTEAEARALLVGSGWRVQRAAVLPRTKGVHHYLAMVCERDADG